MRARRLLLGLATAALAATPLLAVGPASARPAPAAGTPDAGTAATVRPLSVRRVDARSYPDLRLTVTAPADAALTVTQAGVPVDAVSVQPLHASDLPSLTVLLVDTSSAMGVQDSLALAKLGLGRVIRERHPDERMAIVSFGVTAGVVVAPTLDTAALLDGLDRLAAEARDEASRNEGLVEALELIPADVVTTDVLLVSASTDDASSVSTAAAAGAVMGADVAVHAVGIDLGRGQVLDTDGLRRVASAVRSGTYREATTPDAVVAAVADADRAIDAQVAVRMSGAPDARVLDLRVAAGGQEARALLTAGQLVTGSSLTPGSVDPALGSGPSFLRTAQGKYVAVGLALVFFVLLAYGVVLIAVRDTTDLDAVLRLYDDRPADADEDQGDERHGTVVKSRLLRRAVALTSQVAEERGVLDKVERSLERANLPLRPAEALFIWIAVVAVGSALALVLGGQLLYGLGGLVATGLLPPAYVNLRAGRRRAAFQALLPDMLQLLSGSLRAGYSLMQGVEAVSREVEEPMGQELRRVVLEARLGRPLDEALDDAAERMGSADFAWAVMAIRIQREVGGNLSELLLTVADTMVHRERLRRDVKSLTAEGRVSAVVLAILPPALGGAMYAINPDYISTLFTERTGNVMLVGSGLLAGGGFVWMKKLAKVEV